MIRASGLQKTYDGGSERVTAVRDVDLHVAAGEFLCIMGPSGCGKSTLLSLLAGVLTPDAGEVRMSGQPLSTLRAEERAVIRLARIGMVFQRDGLIEEFTARENVALPMEMIGSNDSNIHVMAKNALAAVGVDDLAARRPSQLSGGQRQRVGIARGIVGTRRVLLADEATGALDHANSERVFALFRELAHGGVTVVAVTHDPLGKGYADRTLHMVDGCLVEEE
jgi:putative ABC transport system ATP-binding protein